MPYGSGGTTAISRGIASPRGECPCRGRRPNSRLFARPSAPRRPHGPHVVERREYEHGYNGDEHHAGNEINLRTHGLSRGLKTDLEDPVHRDPVPVDHAYERISAGRGGSGEIRRDGLPCGNEDVHDLPVGLVELDHLRKLTRSQRDVREVDIHEQGERVLYRVFVS